jgi:flavin-dependent dehydrogenase
MLAGDAAEVEGEPLVVAREIEFEMSFAQRQHCPVSPEIPELFFTPDLRGYGWIFRKGAHLNVGLGRQDPHAFPAHFEAFMLWLEDRRLVPQDAPRARGHAYLLYGPTPRPLVADGALLAGDAAGFAYPRSGEGIRPAIESGLLAARTIAAAAGRYDVASLAAYARAIEARFGSRRAPGGGPLDWLPGAWRESIVRRALAWPPFAKKVVIDRWFLHRDEQPLAS